MESLLWFIEGTLYCCGRRVGYSYFVVVFCKRGAVSLFRCTGSGALSRRSPLTSELHPAALSRIMKRRRVVKGGALLCETVGTSGLASIVFCNPPKANGAALTGMVTGAADTRFARVGTAMTNGGSVRTIMGRTRRGLNVCNGGAVLFVSRVRHFGGNRRSCLLPFMRSKAVVLVNTAARGPCFRIGTTLVSHSVVFRLGSLRVSRIGRLVLHTIGSGAGKVKGCGTRVSRSTLSFLTSVTNNSTEGTLGTVRLNVLAAPHDRSNLVRVALSITSRYVRGHIIHCSGGKSGRCSVVSTFVGDVHNSSPSTTICCLTGVLCTKRSIGFVTQEVVVLTSRSVKGTSPRTLYMTITTTRTMRHMKVPRSRVVLSRTIACVTYTPGDGSTIGTVFTTVSSIGHAGAAIPPRLRSTRCNNRRGLNRNVNCGCTRSCPGRCMRRRCLPARVRKRRFCRLSRVNCRGGLGRCRAGVGSRSWWGGPTRALFYLSFLFLSTGARHEGGRPLPERATLFVVWFPWPPSTPRSRPRASRVPIFLGSNASRGLSRRSDPHLRVCSGGPIFSCRLYRKASRFPRRRH